MKARTAGSASVRPKHTDPAAGVPATTFNAKHTMHQGVEFGASVELLRDIAAPGDALIGVQAGMKLPYGLSIYADARNLTNQHYASDVTTIIDARGQSPAVFYPGNGRAIYGGFRWAF